jgi:hypothetical protein
MKADKWEDPAKRKPKESTMNAEGNFGTFTEFMRKIVKAKPEKNEPKPLSSSRVPAASS